MFNWVCPQCGKDVPPSKTECPYCAERAKEAASAGPPQPVAGWPQQPPPPPQAWQPQPPAPQGWPAQPPPPPPQPAWQPQAHPQAYHPGVPAAAAPYEPQRPAPPPPPPQYQPAPPLLHHRRRWLRLRNGLLSNLRSRNMLRLRRPHPRLPRGRPRTSRVPVHRHGWCSSA